MDMEQEHIDAWANMHKLTLTIPNDNRFDMEQWGSYNYESMCNTSACMAGHAALHPHFRKLGLGARIHWESEKGNTYAAMSVSGQTHVFGDDTHPFDPDYVRTSLDIEEYDEYGDQIQTRITPQQAADAIEYFILEDWGIDPDVWEKAKSEATAEYDAKWVHMWTPWNPKTFDEESFCDGHSSLNGA